jgi:hypothetical protein
MAKNEGDIYIYILEEQGVFAMSPMEEEGKEGGQRSISGGGK